MCAHILHLNGEACIVGGGGGGESGGGESGDFGLHKTL